MEDAHGIRLPRPFSLPLRCSSHLLVQEQEPACHETDSDCDSDSESSASLRFIHSIHHRLAVS
jgi:hypothetical protein